MYRWKRYKNRIGYLKAVQIDNSSVHNHQLANVRYKSETKLFKLVLHVI